MVILTSLSVILRHWKKVPMYDRANKKNQIRQKDKSFSNLKRWESTLVSVFVIILMISKPYQN